jgi:hypothetical protein
MRWAKSGKLFRLTPLSVGRVDVGPEDDAQKLVEQAAQLSVGPLEDSVIVSMPETTTTAAAMVIQKQLREAFPGKTVIIVTHNVHFLIAEPVGPLAAKKLLAQIGDEAMPAGEMLKGEPTEFPEGADLDKEPTGGEEVPDAPG